MLANLHLHSRHSDGADWPSDVVARAQAAGLSLVALTDHDTFRGQAEFRRAAASVGLAAVVGVEIDCIDPESDYASELLAYFPSGAFPRTGAFLEGVGRARRALIEAAVVVAAERLPDRGLSFAGLIERKRADRPDLGPDAFSLNKVDVYKYLLDAGALPPGSDYPHFKASFFASDPRLSTAPLKSTCAQVVDLVRADGGYAVIPHPGHEFGDSAARMAAEAPRLRRLLERFRGLGVSGVEMYWYRNADTAELNRLVAAAAGPLGFFFTYGSDCHGPGSGKQTLGQFAGDFSGFPAS
jgi:predicted metal-dependent phosphoesterase TrpH